MTFNYSFDLYLEGRKKVFVSGGLMDGSFLFHLPTLQQQFSAVCLHLDFWLQDLASGSENWSSSSGSPASSLKENFEPDAEMVTGIPKESEQPIKKLTVIARHRRLGEESLSKLKEEVRKYALDHTFKETAKKFGIHHSTVSGWVKAREKVATRHTLALMKHKAFSGKFTVYTHCSVTLIFVQKVDI